MVFDNGWIDVEDVSKLPPHGVTCQALVKGSDKSLFVTTDRITQLGEGFASWPGRKVIAHQPLALPPTPPEQSLIARLVSRLDWSAAPATLVREAIGIIDSERAIAAPFDDSDMADLRRCYERALEDDDTDSAESLARAIARLEVMT